MFPSCRLAAVATLFATKVLYLLGLFLSQARTMVLSHQACVSSTAMANASLLVARSSTNKAAPHSSSLGLVSCLRGATLVLAVTSLQVVRLLG